MLGIPIIVIYNLFQNRELIANTNNKKVQNNGLLSIMLETNSGSGEYTQSETNKFPASGYLFNETLSGCENNGTLTYDKAKKKVILKNITIQYNEETNLVSYYNMSGYYLEKIP